jgi:hypothetical protein
VSTLKERGTKIINAPACYGSFLGSNPDISQKYKMGDIKQREWPTHSKPPKKYFTTNY